MKGNESSDFTRQCAVLTWTLQKENYQEIKKEIFSLKTLEKESLLMPKFYLVIFYSPNLTKFTTHVMIQDLWRSLAYQNLPNRDVNSLEHTHTKARGGHIWSTGHCGHFPPVLSIVYLIFTVHLLSMIGERVLIMLPITSTFECTDIRQN